MLIAAITALILAQSEPYVGLAGMVPDPKTPQAVAEEQIKGLLETRLKDPESARYTFGALRPASCRQGFMGRAPRYQTYAMEFTVNAKNSYGGYTGAQPFTYIAGYDAQVFQGANFGPWGYGACRWE